MYEVLLKQARLIDGLKVDIGIKDGVIKKIASKIEEEAEKVIRFEKEEILSAGWIDSHVHCFEEMNLYYDFPDEIGISKGVTTVVDAGSTGAKNVGEFYTLAKKAKTNVLALLNISEWGIIEQDELADLEKINPQLITETLNKYPEFIIGLKARMSKTVIGENGIIPLQCAKEIQKENGMMPLMVHIGSAPPELSDILALLEEGDIVTHCFNGKANGILASDDTIKDFVWQAYNKGVIFDIGHGTDSFNFHVAKIAHEQHMKAATISTDIYHRNRENGPVYDLATTMEKLLSVNYSLKEVIAKVTSKPAEVLHLSNKGKIAEGYDADFTVFKISTEEKELIDSNGNTQTSKTKIIPLKAIVGGEVYNVK